jgi:hypothetical protein
MHVVAELETDKIQINMATKTLSASSYIPDVETSPMDSLRRRYPFHSSIIFTKSLNK